MRFHLQFRDYCPPCYPGSMSLPPVLCRSYTGRHFAGLSLDAIRGPFIKDFLIGRIDAPNFIPAGSHCAPRITVNGKPSLERAHIIYPREVDREVQL